MTRLAGFSANRVIQKLRRAGFVLDREAKGSHEIWRNPETGARTIVPHHPGDLPEDIVRKIVRQAKMSVDEFLKL